LKSVQHTAILVFTRTSNDEAKAKAFVKANFKVNQQLAKLLISKTVLTAENTGLPTFVSYSSQQKGQNFGERLANACQDIFNRGFERLIIIGNDSPSLNSQLILKANTALNQQKMLIGPTDDGGTYLIGLHQSAFNFEAFKNLDWQTENLLSSILKYGQNHGASQLNQLFDINSTNDFYRYAFILKEEAALLYALFKKGITLVNHWRIKQFTINPKLYLSSLLPQRAPPLRFC